LRSWGNRDDTFVCDEPLYAYYLVATGIDHPGCDEILTAHETDWKTVVDWLTGVIPGGKEIFYQKHMAHHLLPEIDRGWLASLTNAFLIRDPREMLTSLVKVTPDISVQDTGLPQQWELFDRVHRQTGKRPPVLDARDVLENPRGVLSRFCREVGVPFTESMLQWEAGSRETDGVWAKYWYAAVERSTCFQPYRAKPDPVPDHLQALHEECRGYYDRMYERRLTASGDNESL
jgi:hypothetical protein